MGSPRLSPCQLSAGSLLPSSPSHSHVELKSCQALSPAAPTWDSCTHGRAEATNASSSSIPGAAIASPTAPREDAKLSRQGKGQGCSTLSNPSSQRATGFCAPWAGVRLCRRSCGSHMALRTRQARMGTGPLPLSWRCCCPACACPGASRSNERLAARAGPQSSSLLQRGQPVSSAMGGKRSPPSPSPATGTSPRLVHTSPGAELLFSPRVTAGEWGLSGCLPRWQHCTREPSHLLHGCSLRQWLAIPPHRQLTSKV